MNTDNISKIEIKIDETKNNIITDNTNKMNANTIMKNQEVVAIIDRSGSMKGKEDDTIGGINSSIEALKDDKDENTNIKVSIKLFDHEEKMLIKSLKLEDVKPLERRQYKPRGQTALLDAIGNTLKYFMDKKTKDPCAYDTVIIYVMTDGFENCSKHYSAKKIKRMIADASDNYNIKILYLAANQDAILEAAKYGINPGQALTYSETPENVDNALRSVANAVRRCSTTGYASFTPLERQASMQPPTIQRQ